MPVIDPKQLLALYADYLKTAEQKLGLAPPQKVAANAKAMQVPATDPYYYPEPFYERLIGDGGLIPIMLYNTRQFKNGLTDAQLETKLQQWTAMDKAYQALRTNPATYGAEYEKWKTSDPAFAGLGDDRGRALYALEKFREAHFQHIVDAPLTGLIAPLTENRKLAGDCDTLSYVMAGLLLNSTDGSGKKLFTPKQVQLDRYAEHSRLRIVLEGKEDVLFESSASRRNSIGESRQDKMITTQPIGPLLQSHSMAGVLGLELYSDKSKIDREMTFMRSMCLIEPKNPLFAKNNALAVYNALVAQGNEMNLQINQMIAQHNAQKPVSEELLAQTYQQWRALGRELKEQLTYGPEATKGDFAAMQEKLKKKGDILRQLNPEKFTALETAYGQAETTDLNSPQTKTPAQAPVSPKKAMSR